MSFPNLVQFGPRPSELAWVCIWPPETRTGKIC